MKPRIEAMYIIVLDMNRAIRFYEEIFGVPASSRDERMSSFNLGGFYFLLLDPTKDGESVVFGNNAIPNIKVEKVQDMLSIANKYGCETIQSIEEVEDMLIAQVKDTEGNVIEFYQST